MAYGEALDADGVHQELLLWCVCVFVCECVCVYVCVCVCVYVCGLNLLGYSSLPPQ